MPKCTVCHHPDLHAIDLALLAGAPSLQALSRQFGPSKSALYRHKEHLQEKISQARRRLDQNLRLGLVFKLNQVLDRVEQAAVKAQAADNVDQVLKAARVEGRLIRDLGKMTAPWDSDTVYRVLTSPQWQARDTLLPTEPAFLAAGHQLLAQALFPPCPQPPSANRGVGDKAAAAVGRPLDVLTALPPETLASLHPDLLESLLLPPASAPPGTAARRQRDASAAKPAQLATQADKQQQNQEPLASEKNVPKNPAPILNPTTLAQRHVGQKSQAPPAISTEQNQKDNLGEKKSASNPAPALNPTTLAQPQLGQESQAPPAIAEASAASAAVSLDPSTPTAANSQANIRPRRPREIAVCCFPIDLVPANPAAVALASAAPPCPPDLGPAPGHPEPATRTAPPLAPQNPGMDAPPPPTSDQPNPSTAPRPAASALPSPVPGPFISGPPSPVPGLSPASGHLPDLPGITREELHALLRPLNIPRTDPPRTPAPPPAQPHPQPPGLLQKFRLWRRPAPPIQAHPPVEPVSAALTVAPRESAPPSSSPRAPLPPPENQPAISAPGLRPPVPGLPASGPSPSPPPTKKRHLKSLFQLPWRQPQPSPWLGFNFRGSPDAPPAPPGSVTVYTSRNR
jgi:hypothetical protein